MLTWWKMRRFQRLTKTLEIGMTREQIRAVLGEPLEISFYRDEVDFDEIWRFVMPRPRHYFEMALESGAYSYAWWGHNPAEP